MVKAILEGRKTQTRRIIKPQPPDDSYKLTTLMSTTGDSKKVGRHSWSKLGGKDGLHIDNEVGSFRSPYGYVGDVLWVRETFGYWGDRRCPCHNVCYCGDVVYKADYVGHNNTACTRWRPSIFMPKKYARIWLEITDIRVERVQEIKTHEIIAEGVVVKVDFPDGVMHRNAFRLLWDSINAKRGYSWESNPWVWVIEFKRLENHNVNSD
jgi:hypothetical protein